MPTKEAILSFEEPIVELENHLDDLLRSEDSTELRDEIQQVRLNLANLKKVKYSNLTPWQTVEVARHPDRPQTDDYLKMCFSEFIELHGDRKFRDDRAIRTGWAKLDEYKVMVVGHQKGHDIKERMACNFGCAEPEGYRKAIEKMKLAAKFGLPIISFIDTPGAYPGVSSEERGISEAIAKSMFEMSLLETPVICVVIGEGGSGGAIGIGVGDKVAMLEHSYYSVISPEGCAGILWKGGEHKEKAASALKFTAKDLLRFGIIDQIISEPVGGAHSDRPLMASRMKQFLRSSLRQLKKVPVAELVEKRYHRFRDVGVFMENAVKHYGSVHTYFESAEGLDDINPIPDSRTENKK